MGLSPPEGEIALVSVPHAAAVCLQRSDRLTLMRRLIVCCDCTWNRADWEGGRATNIIRLARAVRPACAGRQPGDLAIPQIV